MRQRTAPELVEKVTTLRKKGHTFRDIARQTGLGESTVQRICKQEGAYLTTSKDKQNMSDIWKQWDYLHRRYGTKKNE